jgi:hypothetical protein
VVGNQVSFNIYTEFARSKPSRLGLWALRYQQAKLMQSVCERADPIDSVLEIGPGWGAFASLCREQRIPYQFIDNSPAIANYLIQKGFVGSHGTSNQLHRIDATTIWMSHVLEHSSSWLDARNMLSHLVETAPDESQIVIIGPDAISWRFEFFNVDFTHGYPTTLRNVIQLMQDVGLTVTYATHHRLASSNFLIRLVGFLLLSVPWKTLDRITRNPENLGRSGFFYNFKINFLLRQICVVGKKRSS